MRASHLNKALGFRRNSLAHPNIVERQEEVRSLLNLGIDFDASLKKKLAEKYSCSLSAINADLVYFRRPSTKETYHTSAAMRKRIFARDGRVCQYCGDRNAYEYIVEHVVPASIGGVSMEYNLVIACQKCNTKKRNSIWAPRNLDEITIDHPQWRERILLGLES